MSGVGDLLVTMDTKEIHDHLRVQGLIKAYQVLFFPSFIL